MKDNDFRAFPIETDGLVNLGMTARDYFACAIFSSFIRMHGLVTYDGNPRNINAAQRFIKTAYDFADIMLSARDTSEPHSTE